MKKSHTILWTFIAFTIIISSLFSSMSSVSAAKTPIHDIPMDIMVNGKYLKTDVDPYVENGITYVPVRFVGEALQAAVSWNSAANTVIIQKGGTTIELTLGSKIAKVNGKKVALAGLAHARQNRTFVPIRFVSEQLGARVNWDQFYYTVKISKSGIVVPSHLTHRNYTENEIFWLGRIIEAESSGEPVKGMIAVGNVILNRVKSSEYPNTIYGVIFDRKYGVQYEPTINGTIYNTPSLDSISSAKRALRGENYVGACLFFFNPRIAQSNWISQNRRYYKTIANHDFYL